jgi:soluble lytic murein transglycosylase-like protein
MTVQEQIIATAQQYRVDRDLALAQAWAESRYDQSRISPKGAIGVFQLMPGTARDLGVDPYNVVQNIEGGIRYLRQMLGQFGGDVQKALAAYNWGPGHLATAIARYGEQWISYIPQETKNYLRDVLNLLGSWLPPVEGPERSRRAQDSPAASAEQEGVNWVLLGLAGILFFFLLVDGS